MRLTYDELPSGSDVRREFGGAGSDGGVTITVPGGETPPAVQRAESRAAMVRAAVVSAVLAAMLAMAAFAAYQENLRRLDSSLKVGAALLAGTFGVGLFLLAWRVERGARLDALAQARRQSTVLHADGGALRVE